MNIFIAGCGRSGTSLMQALMASYRHTHVEPNEHPPARFADLDPRTKHIVVKRNSSGWRELTRLEKGIGIIYMVRHPYDCLTSFHPRTEHKGFHISPNRWLNEYKAWRSIRGRENTIVVRYEDLVANPDKEQVRISMEFDLRRSKLFSQTVTVHSSSVGKWRESSSFRNYIVKLPIQWWIAMFCEEFDYGTVCL